MIIRMISVILASIVSVSAVQAQRFDTMTQQLCNDSWAILTETNNLSVNRLPRMGVSGFCLVTDLKAELSEGSVRLDALEWRGRDFDRYITGELPPTALDLRISGLRSGVAPTEIPAFFTLNQPVDVIFAGDWDASENSISTALLKLNFAGNGAVQVRTNIENIDLASEAAMKSSVSRMRVTELEIDISSSDYVASILKEIFGNATPDEINSVPDPILPSQSKVVLQQALVSAPTNLRITVQSDRGMGLSNLVAALSAANDGSRRQLDSFLPDATIMITAAD